MMMIHYIHHASCRDGGGNELTEWVMSVIKISQFRDARVRGRATGDDVSSFDFDRQCFHHRPSRLMSAL
jgi:hypothetical protein